MTRTGLHMMPAVRMPPVGGDGSGGSSQERLSKRNWAEAAAALLGPVDHRSQLSSAFSEALAMRAGKHLAHVHTTDNLLAQQPPWAWAANPHCPLALCHACISLPDRSWGLAGSGFRVCDRGSAAPADAAARQRACGELAERAPDVCGQ